MLRENSLYLGILSINIKEMHFDSPFIAAGRHYCWRPFFLFVEKKYDRNLSVPFSETDKGRKKEPLIEKIFQDWLIISDYGISSRFN